MDPDMALICSPAQTPLWPLVAVQAFHVRLFLTTVLSPLSAAHKLLGFSDLLTTDCSLPASSAFQCLGSFSHAFPSLLSHRTQDNQTMGGTTHNDMGPPISVTKTTPYRFTRRQILWGILSFEVPSPQITTACVK